MIDGRYNVEFEFAIRRGLEDTGVDLDLFYTGAVELLECRNNASLFTST